MSNRLFQGIVHQMRDSIDRVIGVIDETSHVIACSDLSKLDSSREYLSLNFQESRSFVRDGYTYKPFGSGSRFEFAVFVEGTDDTAARYASILAISVSNIKQYYDEKYDRGSFIKNVILDNILPGDVYIKAREL
ncbi:MAG: PucR family transcriptional regulator, partial [Oscillospiraceae bacterium]